MFSASTANFKAKNFFLRDHKFHAAFHKFSNLHALCVTSVKHVRNSYCHLPHFSTASMAKPASHHFSQRRPKSSLYCRRLSFLVLILFSLLFLFLQIPHFYWHFRTSIATPLQKQWPLMHQFRKIIQTTMQNLPIMNKYKNDPMVALELDAELEAMAEKLRGSVSFLPLKDIRYADNASQGHTWFMSSLDDTHDEGDVQYQYFPSEPSKGRVLCLKGRDTHDGSRNYYALAWWEFLPRNATAMKGLTFVSYNHYNYDNIWHGLSASLPFVAWYQRKGCRPPDRWILYHWGEIRQRMGTWLGNLMEATFGGSPVIESFNGVEDGNPVCFEEAVVMRHNEGGMSLQRRMEAYDLMRCRARSYCNVSSKGRKPKIRLTMFMRTGPRSFRNDSLVIEIFRKACARFEECQLTVAYSHNLTFCEQVKLMSETDILVSPHGAQLTNMFLMDRNSSVMEFFPKGWLELAGVGQYVYHWMASWSGMRHRGAWRDPEGDTCPYQENKRRCMSYYKSGRIGHDKTHFTEWARKVVNEVRSSKRDAKYSDSSSVGCTCGKT